MRAHQANLVFKFNCFFGKRFLHVGDAFQSLSQALINDNRFDGLREIGDRLEKIDFRNANSGFFFGITVKLRVKNSQIALPNFSKKFSRGISDNNVAESCDFFCLFFLKQSKARIGERVSFFDCGKRLDNIRKLFKCFTGNFDVFRHSHLFLKGL